MILFQSMFHIVLYIAVTAAAFLYIALKRNPLSVAGALIQELLTTRKLLLHFCAMIAILFFNKIELAVEHKMTIKNDFTPSVYQLEGKFVFLIQRLFEHEWLTVILAYFYVAVFPALLITSIGIYIYQKNYRLFYALCYAIMLNYMIAIPFYLFFPVKEIWAYPPAGVDFLMLQAFPAFEQVYRPLSGLDNCFPSLHTSISVTLAAIALRSSNIFWSKFVPVCAVIIIFSIFYLGIHWATDMLGGLILGLFASGVALRLAEGGLFIGEVGLSRKKVRDFGGKL
jgi:membrane-associated phospholipid phosphatase